MNSLAKLFVQVLALKETSACWPMILQALNEDDEPRIRTLLLELRSHPPVAPLKALQAIEDACIAAKKAGESPSRAELLELALAGLGQPNSK